MTLDLIRNIIYLVCREKNIKDLFISPEMFGTWLHQFSLAQFKTKLGLPEQYQPGMPLPAQAYEITERISADFAPFKVLMGKSQETLPLKFDDRGYADKPANFYYPGYMMYNYKGVLRRVDILSDLEWSNRLSDAVEIPTFRNPVANFQKNFIRILPTQIQFCEFEYLRLPKEPVFGYKKDHGWVEYDSSKSTELEWDELNLFDIITRFLVAYGVSINAQVIAQYADMVKTKGS